MTKISKRGPKYSGEREWRVILEDLRSQFRVFGEGLQIMNARLDRIEGRLDRIEGRLDRIEADVATLKTDMAFVKRVLPTLATKDDLRPMEKRISTLEHAS